MSLFQTTVGPAGAWHGSQQLKDATMAKLERMIGANQLVPGAYATPATADAPYQACLIGAMFSTEGPEGWESGGENLHERFPIRFGLPIWLAYLWDTLFEAMSPERRELAALAWLNAISPGMTAKQFQEEYRNFLLHLLSNPTVEELPEVQEIFAAHVTFRLTLNATRVTKEAFSPNLYLKLAQSLRDVATLPESGVTILAARAMAYPDDALMPSKALTVALRQCQRFHGAEVTRIQVIDPLAVMHEFSLMQTGYAWAREAIPA